MLAQKFINFVFENGYNHNVYASNLRVKTKPYQSTDFATLFVTQVTATAVIPHLINKSTFLQLAVRKRVSAMIDYFAKIQILGFYELPKA